MIRGNRIGTNRDGTAALGNVRGIFIHGARAENNVVDDNLISGNSSNGVRIEANNNTLTRNRIGTNAVGDAAVPNGNGVMIFKWAEGNTVGGDATAGEGNLISGNRSAGVQIARSKGNSVLGNLIGTNAAGVAALGNGEAGIRISATQNFDLNFVGGSGTGQGNVISRNGDFGVLVFGTRVRIQGNRIGTSPDGSAAIANGVGIFLRGSGIEIGGAGAGEGNLISGNLGAGVQIERGSGSSNLLQGNWIGLDAAGTAALGNKFGVLIVDGSFNLIGGVAPGAGNVISGNDLNGVVVKFEKTTNARENRIEGNLIGTNAAGTAAVGNGGHGVVIDNMSGNMIGGTSAGAGSVISGNAGSGVKIIGPQATGNMVLGNTIGTDAAGTTPIANREGVLIGDEAANNSVGDGTQAGSNTIARNTQRGVWINATAGTGNRVRRNSIHDNGSLGIALATVGVLPNDAGDPDTGANNRQNTPEIQSVVENGADMLDVTFLVDSTTTHSTYDLTVEIFVADGAAQEGETFLATVPYTAALAGSPIVVTIPKAAAVLGTSIVATATDSSGNTSEFSAPALVTAMPVLPAGAAAASSGAAEEGLVDGAFAEFGQA